MVTTDTHTHMSGDGVSSASSFLRTEQGSGKGALTITSGTGTSTDHMILKEDIPEHVKGSLRVEAYHQQQRQKQHLSLYSHT